MLKSEDVYPAREGVIEMRAIQIDVWLIAVAGLLLGVAYLIRGLRTDEPEMPHRRTYFELMGIAACIAAVGVGFIGDGLYPSSPMEFILGFIILAIGGLVMSLDYGVMAALNAEGKRPFYLAVSAAAVLASGLVLHFGWNLSKLL